MHVSNGWSKRTPESEGRYEKGPACLRARGLFQRGLYQYSDAWKVAPIQRGIPGLSEFQVNGTPV